MSMKNEGRYNTEGLSEGEYESGSDEQVLKNLLGIKSKEKIDLLEASLLVKTVDKLIDTYNQTRSLTANDICKIHKIWLGSIYSWAGKYRQVNMSKDGFPFAAANLIPKLMTDFEKTCLHKFTPCNFETEDKITEALAIVHVEFVLIHPFREGNGRIARLISNLMALQAGLPELDFTEITGEEKEKYFAAVRAGLDRNYQPMKDIFDGVIKKTLKNYEK
jgi:cell filamentation protein